MSTRPTSFYERQIRAEKLAIFTSTEEITVREFREFLVEKWHILSAGLDNGTILFIAGVHGTNEGKLGDPANNLETMKKQFEIGRTKEIRADMAKRNIHREFIGIPDYYINEDKKQIDEEKFIKDIETINATMVAMVICYSQLLEIKFLLESKGIFSEARINRDLCLQSKGQILTMSGTQKKFLQTMAQPENIEKNVWIEGQVGSGKTLMGLEVAKMKVAHYMRKFDFNANEGQEKLRVIVAFDHLKVKGFTSCKLLKTQLETELAEDIGKQCSFEIHCDFNKYALEKTIEAHNDYCLFQKTIILIDECSPSMLKTAEKFEIENELDVDYVHCMSYERLGNKREIRGQDVMVSQEEVFCQLLQCQRSSQPILELANFISRHNKTVCITTPNIQSKESFAGPLPKWIEAQCTNDFIAYATSTMSTIKDVMLIYKEEPDSEIKELCSKMDWKCVCADEINGSESSVVIIWDYEEIFYELLTRAKHQLVIVTTQKTQK